LEQNTDIRVIRVLLGHAKLDNPALYTRVATKTISAVPSPLEHIAIKLKELLLHTTVAHLYRSPQSGVVCQYFPHWSGRPSRGKKNTP
jgi:hypothetical protein